MVFLNVFFAFCFAYSGVMASRIVWRSERLLAVCVLIVFLFMSARCIGEVIKAVV